MVQKIIKENGVWYTFGSDLDSFIDCVFIENYFSKKNNQGVSNRIVPDNTVELILTDQKFERKISNQDQTHILKSHLSGLKTKWQDIKLEGSPIISIRFKPEKIYHLTHCCASELTNQCLDPIDVFGQRFEPFQDRLFNKKNTSERINLIEKFFSSIILKDHLKDNTLLQIAKKSIEKSEGNIRIKGLSASLNISQKTLENKFKFYLGITPKEYCRLIRFISSVKKYKSTSINLTQLAHANYFSDQSHLIKEYYAFTGYSPKMFLPYSKGVQEDIF